VVVSAVQDPRKDVIPQRDLFTIRGSPRPRTLRMPAALLASTRITWCLPPARLFGIVPDSILVPLLVFILLISAANLWRH
jgi:hypothetical protein